MLHREPDCYGHAASLIWMQQSLGVTEDSIWPPLQPVWKTSFQFKNGSIQTIYS